MKKFSSLANVLAETKIQREPLIFLGWGPTFLRQELTLAQANLEFPLHHRKASSSQSSSCLSLSNTGITDLRHHIPRNCLGQGPGKAPWFLNFDCAHLAALTGLATDVLNVKQ